MYNETKQMQAQTSPRPMEQMTSIGQEPMGSILCDIRSEVQVISDITNAIDDKLFGPKPQNSECGAPPQMEDFNHYLIELRNKLVMIKEHLGLINGGI